MALELGNAYVTLLPSARGFGKAMAAQVGQEMKGAGADAGQTLGREISAEAAKAAAQGAAAGGTTAGRALADAAAAGVSGRRRALDRIAGSIGGEFGKGLREGLAAGVSDTKGAESAGARTARALREGGEKRGEQAGRGVGARFAGGVQSGIASRMRGIAAVIAGGLAVDRVKDALGESITAASELQQSAGSVQAVFKGAAGDIARAGKNAEKLGLSMSQYNEMASTVGSSLKNNGDKKFTEHTKNLISLGADLAAMYGGTTKDAVESLSSALRGEFDPAERFGVTLSANAVQAEALATGLIKPVKNLDKIKAAQIRAAGAETAYAAAVKKHGKNSAEAQTKQASLITAQSALAKAMQGSTPQMTAQARQLATLSLLTKQTKDAQGAAAREQGSYQSQMEKFRAATENLSAEIGAKLLPYVTRFITWINAKGVPGIKSFADGMEKGTGRGGQLMSALRKVRDVAVPLLRFIADHKGAVAAAIGALAVGAGVVKSINRTKAAYTGLRSAISATASAARGVKSAAGGAASVLGSFKKGLDEGISAGSQGKVASLGGAFKTLAGNAKTAAGNAAKVGAQKTVDGLKSLAGAAASAGRALKTAAAQGLAFAAAQARAGAAALIAAARTGILAASQLAASAATGLLTAAQAALDAVLSVNPLVLAAVALVALGAALVVAYKKSETFRNIVNAAFGSIKRVAAGLVSWFKDTAWPVLKSVLGWIGGRFQWLWDHYYKPVFGAMRRVGGALVEWFRKTAWPTLSKVLGWIGSKTRSMWTTYISPAFAAIKKGVSAVVTAFGRARDGIGSAWSGIVGKIKGPINTVLSFVQKHFIDPLNSMLGKIGVGFRIPSISSGQGKASAASAPFRLKGTSTATTAAGIPAFAAGGRIRGPWRGPRADNVLGISAAGLPVARVNPGEFITRVASVRRMERDNPGALEYINRHGRLPGLAGGGAVTYPAMAAWAAKHIPGLVVTSTTGGGHATGSYHYRGEAIDLSGSEAAMQAGARAIAATFGNSITELIHNPGFAIKYGRNVGPGYYRSVWGDHRNHVHWAMADYSKGSGGILGFLTDPVGEVKKQAASLLSHFPGGLWGQAAAGVAGKAVSGIVSRVTSAVSSLWDTGKNLVGDGVNTVKGWFGGSGVSRWSGLVSQALRMTGQPASLAADTLRRMQQESGGNPRAQNNWDSNARAGHPSKGLMQVIDGTFARWAMPGYDRNIWDPLSNILASMRYAIGTYGSLAAAYGRRGGYADGGRVLAPTLYDTGGWLPPGLTLVSNQTGRPERVRTAEQERALTDSRGGGTTNITVNGVRGDDLEGFASQVLRATERAERRRRTLATI